MKPQKYTHKNARTPVYPCRIEELLPNGDVFNFEIITVNLITPSSIKAPSFFLDDERIKLSYFVFEEKKKNEVPMSLQSGAFVLFREGQRRERITLGNSLPPSTKQNFAKYLQQKNQKVRYRRN